MAEAHQVVVRFDAPQNATEIHLPPGYKAVGITQHPLGIIVWGERMIYAREAEADEKATPPEAKIETEPVHEPHPYMGPPPEEESQEAA